MDHRGRNVGFGEAGKPFIYCEPWCAASWLVVVRACLPATLDVDFCSAMGQGGAPASAGGEHARLQGLTPM